VNTKEGFWYCQNEGQTIANSDIPKLPVLATNIIYIISLLALFFFTKIRDKYRKRDEKGDTVTIQLWLIGVAITNLIITVIVVCIQWSST